MTDRDPPSSNLPGDPPSRPADPWAPLVDRLAHPPDEETVDRSQRPTVPIQRRWPVAGNGDENGEQRQGFNMPPPRRWPGPEDRGQEPRRPVWSAPPGAGEPPAPESRAPWLTPTPEIASEPPSPNWDDRLGDRGDRGEQIFIDAWDAADREAAPVIAAHKRRSNMLLARELVETLILALFIFMAVRGVVQNFRVEGSSMDPTYNSGQYVLVNKALYARLNLDKLGKVLPFIDSEDTARHLFRGPKRGEVVVFHPPLPNSFDRDFIKRVIGLPGDHVQVRDGRVFVNGQELQEQYLRSAQTFCGGQWCDVTLGEDEYYMMGDNRTNSSDSRLWGPVRGNRIIGKTWLIYLPFGDFGPAPNQAPGAAASGNGSPPR
jgi:signal peptidase I